MPENKGYAHKDKVDRVKTTIRTIRDEEALNPDGAEGWNIHDVADPWKFMEKDLHPKAGEGEFHEGGKG